MAKSATIIILAVLPTNVFEVLVDIIFIAHLIDLNDTNSLKFHAQLIQVYLYKKYVKNYQKKRTVMLDSKNRSKEAFYCYEYIGFRILSLRIR